MICLVSSLQTIKSTKLYETGPSNNTVRERGVYTVCAKKIKESQYFFLTRVIFATHIVEVFIIRKALVSQE